MFLLVVVSVRIRKAGQEQRGSHRRSCSSTRRTALSRESTAVHNVAHPSKRSGAVRGAAAYGIRTADFFESFFQSAHSMTKVG